VNLYIHLRPQGSAANMIVQAMDLYTLQSAVGKDKGQQFIVITSIMLDHEGKRT